MRKNFSAADLVDAKNDVLSKTSLSATPKKLRRIIRPSLSASDLKSMGTFPPIDIYLLRLKCKARKMHLDTRRPSYNEWRASLGKYNSDFISDQKEFQGIPDDNDFKRINSSLHWIREELTKMREQDQDLARQFLTIHSEIQRLRLEWSWQYHELTLQEAAIDYQEVDEIKRISDLPLMSDTELSLLGLGLTKMNLCHRKYSVM